MSARRAFRLVVVALGGNALAPPRAQAAPDDERAAVARAASELAALANQGTRLLVVHGNGPQVGRLLAAEAARAPLGLDRDIAETQGDLGYLIAEALEARAPETPVAALVTRVLVAADDPAFARPRKPVGALLAAPDPGFPCRPVAGGGWRRVVASPRPRAILEADAIARLIETHHVVAGGGGGVALALENGTRGPCAAVVDKDWVAARLAVALDAAELVFVTDVAAAYDDFAGPSRAPIDAMSAAAARARLAEGVFAEGSMKPKVESALDYVEASGRTARIARLGALEAALAGRSGTAIRRSAGGATGPGRHPDPGHRRPEPASEDDLTMEDR